MAGILAKIAIQRLLQLGFHPGNKVFISPRGKYYTFVFDIGSSYDQITDSFYMQVRYGYKRRWIKSENFRKWIQIK